MQTHMNARIRLHPLGKVGRHAFAKIAAADDEIYLRIESGQEHRCLGGRISCSDHVQWAFVAQKRFNMRRGIVDTGTAELAQPFDTQTSISNSGGDDDSLSVCNR